MIIKTIKDEDTVNYKKCSMFIGTNSCTFKCEHECGIKGLCQNSDLVHQPSINITDKDIVSRYMSNIFSSAVVIGGLEPFDQFDELFSLINEFRTVTNDDIVIYTGYCVEEVLPKINKLLQFKNIYVKFGRYVPNKVSHYDDILGVKLASDNQYGEKIS